jgi:chemotaxis protein methyltransferase CheR
MASHKEFDFRPRDFARIRQLIHAHAGISLGEGKSEMVYSRLARRLRATGLSSFADYLALVEQDRREFEELVNALTTNLTAFFREPHHFATLGSLLQQRVTRGQVALWSAACSTGEEAYSMAIAAIEALGEDAARVSILASDLDTRAVRAAELGIYPLERVEILGPERLRRFFLRGAGEREGFVRVRPEVRQLLRFRAMNLVAPDWPVRGPFDAIFCRNAMIYFDKPTQRRILERFHPLLHHQGLMFAGHSESFGHCADLFVPRGNTVYAPVIAGRAG